MRAASGFPGHDILKASRIDLASENDEVMNHDASYDKKIIDFGFGPCFPS